MVLTRRLEYGFNGYQVPSMPRAARSTRRRSSLRKNVEDTKLCAFDLLATLAGNLLVGKSSSTSTSNSSTQNDNCVINDLNGEEGYLVDQSDYSAPQKYDQSSCEKEVINSQIIQPDQGEAKLNPSGMDTQASAGDLVSVKLAGTVDTKDQSERLDVDMLSCEQGNAKSERDGDLVGDGPSVFSKLEVETCDRMKVESHGSVPSLHCGGADMYSLKDRVTCDKKPPAQHRSNNSLHELLYENKNQALLSSIPVESDALVVSRDDDDNSSGCTHPGSSKPFRPVPYIGDQRIKKVLASQNCKVIPRYRNKVQRLGGQYLAQCQDNERWFSYQRCRSQSQRNFPFKKRKFYDMECQKFSDKVTGSKGQDTTCTFRKSLDKDYSAPDRYASLAVQRSAFPEVYTHVKLRIESFRVPEMHIEMPETATIGSLKNAVVDAVTTILGGGLHVGVLLQGKKVGDDSKTLQQTGISHDRALDSLSFMLEPDPAHYPTAVIPGSSSFLLRGDPPRPLMRYPSAPAKVLPVTCDKLAEPRGAHLKKLVESDRDSTTSPMSVLTKGRTESKALLPISSMNVGVLSAVPIHRKSNRSEIAQRRIRCPFSVAEVEALVQSVEKLGTGRWRDVKLRAFDIAQHRTYVDLKDKWKTLVHTAKISPQQRRGEPVPQELLDRVLTAHAYWSQSQQQARQQQLKQNNRWS